MIHKGCFFKILIMHLVFISECKNSSNYVKIHQKFIVKSFARFLTSKFFRQTASLKKSFTTLLQIRTMTSLNWNLENLYKCPGFFGEISEEDAKDILREAFQNGKTNCEGILFLKVRKFLNQILLFSFPPKETNDFFIDSGKKLLVFMRK